MLVGIACALTMTVVLGCSSDDTSPMSSGGAGGLPESAVDAGGSVAGAGGGADATEDLGAITMTQIEVGTLTFDVRVAGPEDGEVVFLLHGFPETSHEWRDMMPVLGRASRATIGVPRSAGSGQSSASRSRQSLNAGSA